MSGNGRVLKAISLFGLILVNCATAVPTFADAADLDHGNVESQPTSCSSLFSSDAMEQLCQYLGCQVNTRCGIVTEELYAGSALEGKTPANEEWNHMGGVGLALANASVCLLKDLHQSPLTTSSTASLFGLNFPIQQTIGFESFDPVRKVFRGYQRAQICAPLAGCFDAKLQSFTATVRENNPATGGGLNIHDGAFSIAQTYGLVLALENANDSFSIKAPAIIVPTPYGDISAQPGMNYQSSLDSTQFLSGDVEINEIFPGASTRVANVMGTIGGAVLETLDARPNHGWVSQTGWGSRQASHPDDPIWGGGLSSPRPDLDRFTVARTPGELTPTAEFSADVNIKYTPPLPDILTEAPLQASFDVAVDPKVDLRFSSELETQFNQGFQEVADEGDGSHGTVTLQAGSEALGSFVLQAGIDLHVGIDLGFWKTTIIDMNAPQIIVPVTDGKGTPDQKLIGQAISYPAPGSAAPNVVYNAPLQQILDTPNSGNPSATTFVNQCLAQSVPAQAPPAPVARQGNAELFQKNLYYPCDICVGHLAISYPTDPSQHTWKTIPEQWEVLARDSAGGPQQWTCDADHVGCYDVCSYNSSSKALTLWKNAMQLDAENQLKGGPGITSVTRPGLACNQPYRPTQ